MLSMYIKCTYGLERFSWRVSGAYNANIYRCRSYLLSSRGCTCKLLYCIPRVPSNPIIYSRKLARRSWCPSSLRRSGKGLRRTSRGSSTKWDTRLRFTKPEAKVRGTKKKAQKSKSFAHFSSKEGQ